MIKSKFKCLIIKKKNQMIKSKSDLSIFKMNRGYPNSQEGIQVGSMMYHHNDAYSKSLGKERHGRMRGYGLGITPSSLSGHGSSQSIASTSTPEDAQELAALRLEVAELRRQ
jgi:hypothetical protein